MLKMRIQHLLETKSSLERRHLTMDELSTATGISCSALYKMNSDPSYNPSKEVMKKLVDYFQCSFDDLFDRTTKFTFDLKEAFPPGETLSIQVIALLAASNDITLLQRLYLFYKNKNSNEEAHFLFFLATGFLKEGMRVFRRLLEDRIASELFKKMDDESKRALNDLKKASDKPDSLYCQTLSDVRNDTIFHYSQTHYSKALHSIKQKKGHFVIGQSLAETRFLIADDIRSEIFRSSIDFDADNEHERNKMRRLIKTMGNLLTFSGGFLKAYLDYRNIEFE